jgi:hypothetical protein
MDVGLFGCTADLAADLQPKCPAENCRKAWTIWNPAAKTLEKTRANERKRLGKKRGHSTFRIAQTATRAEA